jgi:hypothetical protein
LAVLGCATADPLPPHSETGRFQFAAHQSDYIGFTETELHLDGIEWGTVFPCHFNNSAEVFRAQYMASNYVPASVYMPENTIL